MEYKITHTRYGDYRLYYQLGWTTGFNRKVLDDEVEKLIVDNAPEICKKHGLILEEISVIDQNFVKCIISATPKTAPTDMVKIIKGKLGFLITSAYPEIRNKCYKQKIWNPSYYLESIGYPTKRTFETYRKNQERGRGPSRDLKTGEKLKDTMFDRIK